MQVQVLLAVIADPDGGFMSTVLLGALIQLNGATAEDGTLLGRITLEQGTAMTPKNPENQAQPGQRRDRLIQERRHDPYHAKLKPREPTYCPECGVVFHEGRWHWAPKPVPVYQETCPACRRIKDDYPAGELTITGAFARQHKTEILHLARHQEEQENGEHPLHRIMRIEEGTDVVVIRTTDIHLPRMIGEALHRAYKGQLDFHYADQEYFLRATWTRTD